MIAYEECIQCKEKFGPNKRLIAKGKCSACYHKAYRRNENRRARKPKIMGGECSECRIPFDEWVRPTKGKCDRCYNRLKYRNSDQFKNKWNKEPKPFKPGITESEIQEIEKFVNMIYDNNYLLQIGDIFQILTYWELINDYKELEKYDQLKPGKQIQRMFNDLEIYLMKIKKDQ